MHARLHTAALASPSLALWLLLPTTFCTCPSLGAPAAALSGELKQWHNVTLTFDGPFARESDSNPNPFTDFRLTVTFTHESGAPSLSVPGYFAADGDAAESSADSGSKWRVHLAPSRQGRWNYRVSFVQGLHAAISQGAGEPVAPLHGATGSFTIAPSDKSGRDFRGKGLLEYAGGRYLRFAGTGEYFLKAGADAPETLLAYADFDGTEPGRSRAPRQGEAAPTQSLHHYAPHVNDWLPGNPTWKNSRGKGLIGALNYLAGKGVNSISFLPYNAGGDGDNVWPFTARTNKFHYDCSKLDQWEIVFNHATQLGLHLHFKLQENEMDDNRVGNRRNVRTVPESLDGGQLGPERKLYCRELIARFAHHLALNWNIGEENTQSTEEVRAMVQYLRDTDPYRHNIVIHTFPDQQDQVYTPLLGKASSLTGASLQNDWDAVHQRTLKWIQASKAAGHPWVVANDEQGSANFGVPPDPGYQGFAGKVKSGNNREYDLHDIRKLTLWGNLMAGGAGVEYYFGYQLPQNDLVCEDFRSRDQSWDFSRIALEFFRDHRIPFQDMENADALIGNPTGNNSKFCLAKPGDLYLVYLPNGGSTQLDLTGSPSEFTVHWFNPRLGGSLLPSAARVVKGGQAVSLGNPPSDPGEDWLAVIRR